MRNWLRGKRPGLLSFLLICGLVVGGLGWVTDAALRLEHAQHEARLEAARAEKERLRQRELEQQRQVRQREEDQQRQAQRREQAQQEALAQEDFAARLRLALWRLDSRIAPVLAREDARPYNHYSAVFAPSVVLDPRGNRYAPAAVLEPSPLLSADLPEWMLLHFQTSAESGWGSPQVLSVKSQRQLSKNGIAFGNAKDERRGLLDELSFASTSQGLLRQVRRQEIQLAAMPDLQSVVVNTAPPANLDGPAKAKDVPQELGPLVQGQQQAGGQQRNPGYGYPSRANFRSQMNNDNKLGTYADNAYAVTQTISNGSLPWAAPARPPAGLREQVLVRTGPMTPLWLSLGSRAERLVVARRVRITSRLVEQLTQLNAWPRAAASAGVALPVLNHCPQSKLPQPQDVCQGIVLDWPRLQKLLAAEVRAIFPKARVLPMRAEAIPPHPERTMTTLPVELDPGEGPAHVALAPQPEAPPPPEAPPVPEPAAAPRLGWTPLRIGLGLAWAAALVALAAVGLGGWSLIDLSERRIRFVSAVTHELRTPLTTLRLYLDMLTGGMVKDEKSKEEYLHTLNTETDRLSRLVGNVLDFSRLENQRPRLVPTETTVGELLEQLRTTWYTHCNDVAKELVVDGGAQAAAALVLDVQLVQQILGNLIDNACKYSQGAEDRHIWVRASTAAGQLVVEVEDRGPGVPKRERRSIFRAFCRGGTADVTAGGVGLGLALAQRWARLLGGALTLCNGADRGACFRLELPLGACETRTDQ